MHTVIVGGGFAGVKAALELSKRQLGKVTLVSDEPYFLHHATLYATATGRNTAESVISLEDMFATHHDVTIVHDTMKSLDPQRKLVVCQKKDIKYDNLIIAIGVVTTYFGVDGMAQHSYSIKTLEDVLAFRNHLHNEIAVDRHMDKNYVVIGAGPTGTELAGALAGYLREIAEAHHVTRTKINITLVEAAPRILPRLSKTASHKVQKQLEKLGIKVLTNHKVESLSKTHIIIEGERIPTETAIWTSGVMNHPFFKEHHEYFTLSKNGRVTVNKYLEAYKDIYVLGDNADTPNTGLAWTALHDAEFIANHLARKATKQSLKAYKTAVFASSVPIGDKWAYIEKHGIYVAGRFGFWLRRLIELTGLKSLLPYNQAVSAWHAYYDHEETCDLCGKR
jgi:NADH dehydrogenase